MEGRILERAGFNPGVRYERTIDAQNRFIELRICDTGNLVVSERKSKNMPIIEINNRAIAPVTDGAEELRIDAAQNVIRISVESLTRKQREREERFHSEIAEGRITKGTVCSGIGMSTLALSDAFTVSGLIAQQKWVVDREGKYNQIAWDNNPAVTDATTIFTASLEQIEPELLGPVSVLNASLPCTGFSVSGRSKNKIAHPEEHATDATAVFGFMKIVEGVNPSIIVSENVKPAQTSATYTLIKSYLYVLGYNVFEVNLDNEQSGCFQKRPRYWFVAVSKGLGSIDLNNVPKFAREYGELRELMDDVPADSPAWSQNQYLKDKAIRDKEAGKYFQRNLINESTTEFGTINRTYARKQSTPPMWQREDGMERLLTANEIARSMACPESLVDGCSQTRAIEGLGQGVDMNQCRGIGLAIVRDIIRGTGNVIAEAVTDVASVAADALGGLVQPANNIPETGDENASVGQLSMFS
ncbi:hypothetical protein A3709_19135 [Halioglobus sp. HI00S01]|nr:hypothetical protein A3709_19135 [Halioglobus sp. HI00S01]